ncbi:MAG TPA: glycoside hydrolase family 2 TIM barrel-domain containing protein [Bacilli bacterium]|nr:glycoside hydrolase family 2 TIM barrel-domain containing protein [Bacilli bacterium]
MQKISLNYDWLFTTDKNAEKPPVNVPHPGKELPLNHFRASELEFISTYEKDLVITAEDLDLELSLLFEGAAHFTQVYLNDELIIENYGGYIPFSQVIKPKVGVNKLKVKVDSSENKSIPPFGGVVDYLAFAGLYREVYLIKKPVANIKDITVTYRDILKSNEVNIDVLTNTDQGELFVELFDAENKVISSVNQAINSNNTRVTFALENKTLWELDNPYLYNVKVTFNKAVYKERFGLRDILFTKKGFYLNGKLLKLIGLNRHQSYPYAGYAMPKGAQREDAKLLKDLGLNIVRTSHYPQSKHFIEACDELGLLVFEEIPGWQHIGDKAWQELSYLNIKRMIKRDKNNPSVIMWGVRINESNDDDAFYKEANELARKLDPTRPTGGVRNMSKSNFFEDVYTYNDFVHEGFNIGLSPKRKITNKNYPYLVTEHNGHMFPTKAFDHEAKRLEQAKRHLNVINSAKDAKNGISGAIGWVFSDYQTHEEFGSGDLICHHGVLDIYRNPKTASYAYQAEGSKDIVFHVSSDLHIGEYPKTLLDDVYVFTNVEYLKLYRNNEYIKTFYPAFKKYPHLKHPPIIIDDFISDLIANNEGLSKKDGERAKKILRAVQISGTNFSLKTKLMILYLFTKYKLTMDEGVALFYKYLSNWGSKQSDYRFDGYINDKLVTTVTKSIYKTYNYELKAERTSLEINETYDATRVTIKKVDQNGSQAHYAFDPVIIKLNNLELIGPSVQTLNSGVLSFWVKTVTKGQGTITVTIGEQQLQAKVEVKDVR